jgi:leader peptidase (prepilin peptidase)/N-methyltransferase
MVVALAAVLGLIFGSFATAVAYRVPRRETIVSGRSRCPNCGRTITAVENIPVVSFLVLRGRCRECGRPISARYPLIELAVATLFALSAWKFGLTLEAVLYSAFAWVLVVLSVIDLEYRLLPNRIVYPSFVVAWAGLVVAAFVRDRTEYLVDAGIGALVFGGFFFVIAFLFPAGMGGGDVKLSFVLGTMLGYLGIGIVVTGMFLSFFLGAIAGIGLMAVKRGGRKTMLPFGPFLALGSLIAVFAGGPIVEAYLGTL